MATDFVSMAAKTSDRGDTMSEVNLQADGLVERPAQGAADRQETEEDSSHQNLPMWSPVQRLPAGCLNMNYCLEIRVSLTDELGDVPPPLHTWTAPVVEDMLWEARDGLTEAILFYGRRSMGEGLKADEARDAAFLLTGAGMWVGKLAYLTANPMMLQEGKRAITEAISDNKVKARGPRHPRVNLPAQLPFRFNTSRTSPPGDLLANRVSDEGQTPRQPSQG